MKFIHMGVGFILFLSALSIVQPQIAGDKEKPWTIMVYLDADNNLESAGIEDFNEMETVGSTDFMNIVVEMDRADGEDTSNGNWTGTKRFYVTKDSDPSNITSRELEDLGEMNMGDPNTLIAFVLWGMENYPAQHYMLVIWDHGGGWYGAAWDDKNDDYLDLNNISYALSEIVKATGKKIDILGFDACLMAGIEVIYECMDYVDYMVCSATTEPNDGWPYEMILPRLDAKPFMSPEELSSIITKCYVESYTDGKDDPEDTPSVAMSAWNTTRFGDVIWEFNQLSMYLSTKAATYNMLIREARDRTTSYDPGHVVFLDILNYPLYDIFELTRNIVHPTPGPVIPFFIDSKIKENVQRLQGAIMKAQVEEAHGQRYSGIESLSVYFPSGNFTGVSSPKTQYDSRYDSTRFAREMYWDEFLHAYFSVRNIANTPPMITIEKPKDGEKLDADNGTIYISGKAFDVQGVEKIEISINGGEWEEIKPGDKWSYKWDISRLNGEYTISARADDGTTQSQIKTIKVSIEGKEETGIAISDYAAVVLAIIIITGGVFFWVRRKRKTKRSRR